MNHDSLSTRVLVATQFNSIQYNYEAVSIMWSEEIIAIVETYESAMSKGYFAGGQTFDVISYEQLSILRQALIQRHIKT